MSLSCEGENMSDSKQNFIPSKTRREIEQEIELSKLMIKDLERLWKSYAKKALIAKQERELKQDKKGFLEYETYEDLHDAYGGGYIDEETFYRGVDYFKNFGKSPELSVIEKHRQRIKEILNREKGTLKELSEELNPTEKAMPPSGFEAYDLAKQAERLKELDLNEVLDRVFGGTK